jgi:hypothetical protein
VLSNLVTAGSLTVAGSKTGVVKKTFEGVGGKIHKFHFTRNYSMTLKINTISKLAESVPISTCQNFKLRTF